MKHTKLKNSYLAAFCKELFMMFETGVAPAEGLLMLMADEPDEDKKSLLRGILTDLDGGATFSGAMGRSGYFSDYMINMLKIGEKTGRTAMTLKALSEYYDRMERIHLAVKNAVIYPLMLLIIMLSVVLLLITTVLPIFNETFNRLGMQMGALARSMMQLGALLKEGAGVLLFVFAALCVLLCIFCLVPGARPALSAWAKKLWGHTGLAGEVAAARFLSAVAIAIDSGLDSEQAVGMAVSVSSGTKKMDAAHERCLRLLQSGGALPESMLGAGIISARDNRMMAIGLKSGMLGIIGEIAARRERTLQDSINRRITRIEPAIVIFSSIFVGIILLSILLPLVEIMASIQS